MVLPPTAGSLAQAVVPPTDGTHTQTLRVGVVACQSVVAELVAAAPSLHTSLLGDHWVYSCLV